MSPAEPTTILIVEDDRELRDLFRVSLTVAGYGVVAVEDGLDALRVIDEGSIPSAVVLDIGLPRLSGHDVRRELTDNPATNQVPIIVVTGTNPGAMQLRAFDCVLQKPVSVDSLLKAVENCLRHKSRSSRT
jgi:DNA-binding response OmpR family regulator